MPEKEIDNGGLVVEKEKRDRNIKVCIQIGESDRDEEDLLKAAEQMIRGGADMIQLEKGAPKRFEPIESALKALAEKYGIPVVEESDQLEQMPLLREDLLTPDKAGELQDAGAEGIRVSCRESSDTLTDETARLIDAVHQALQQGGYKAAVFDYDGTIVDSMPMWSTVASRFAAGLGVEVEEGFDEQMKYLSLEESAGKFREFGAVGTNEEIVDQVMDMVLESYRDLIPLKPGILEVLKDLQAHGIRMSIATQTPSRMIYAANQRLGLEEYFDTVYSCSEWETQKREADIYYLAAASIGAAPCETLVFEDMVYAAETANRAGFTVMGIYDESSENDRQRIEASCRLYMESYEDWPGIESFE